LDKITKGALFFQCVIITKLFENYCHIPLNPPNPPPPTYAQINQERFGGEG
jgi:hypothetical protein